ncbi:fibronectin type III domain protein [Dysgonomonas alginatilytica]|uniref:Fibronectin type III domain protein n=1 Tax=Dysgonomonas alginatilytica TaxID=1605892 RepID=A0A2V3PTD6_9BACT|nr:fibronectin type III domain-containing protein [Dysgonomonas alginatilytica]PXV68970.1 fibronectin type III domain protein [Dysgonomonas alginatilytica]
MRLSYYYITYLFFVILIFSACEKEEVFVSAKEPVIANPDESFITGDFTVEILSRTDHDIFLKWYPVANADKYEILVNDTMTVSENIVKENNNNYYSFRLTNLEPDTDYKLSIRAISKDLNIKLASGTTRTHKETIANVLNVILDKYKYDRVGFGHCIPVQDKGYLLIGNAFVFGKQKIILLKLDSDYNISWLKEKDNTDEGTAVIDVKEFSNGSFLLMHSKGATQIDKEGNQIWSKEIKESNSKEDLLFNKCLTLPDGCSVLVGSLFSYGPTNRYYITKLSKEGNVLWEIYGPSRTYTDMYILTAMKLSPNNNIVIAGATWNDGMAYQGSATLALVECDLDGNLISDITYDIEKIPYYIFDINNIFPVENNSFYILGTASDYSSTRRNTITLTIKIDNNRGLWYRENSFSAGGYFPKINLATLNDDGTFFCMIHDDRGIIFADIRSNGEISNSVGYYNYPSGIFAIRNKENQIVYFTSDGRIITLNPDGYSSSK